MSDNSPGRARTIQLDFEPDSRREKPVRANLSAVAAAGGQLWFGTDEGTFLDRLTAAGADRYTGHEAVDLKDWLELPNTGGKKDEIDIEGLCVAGDCLWLVGSHAATRDKPDPKKDGPKKAIEDLADIDGNPNRRTLARFRLEGQKDSDPTLGAAAQLPATKETSPLLEALAEDPHLGPFLAIPAKENGFDVEGLAVADGRLFLGLRGPVLRGWAVLLELKVGDDNSPLELKPNGPNGRCYRKHFLDLEGCGVRDLCVARDGELLVLAGPTMALDGAVRVHRWRIPEDEAEDTIAVEAECPAVLEIPHRRGRDRAEGIELLGGRGGSELLVVYDSPAEDRVSGENSVDADVFALRL